MASAVQLKRLEKLEREHANKDLKTIFVVCSEEELERLEQDASNITYVALVI